MNQLSEKESAIEFLQFCCSGKIRDAYAKHVAPNFRHHNPYFRGTAQALMEGMEQNAAKNPDKIMEVQRVLQDGDMVAVHSHVLMKPGDLGVAVVHIFRFEGSQIAELWDIGQAVPAVSPNEFGAF